MVTQSYDFGSTFNPAFSLSATGLKRMKEKSRHYVVSLNMLGLNISELQRIIEPTCQDWSRFNQQKDIIILFEQHMSSQQWPVVTIYLTTNGNIRKYLLLDGWRVEFLNVDIYLFTASFNNLHFFKHISVTGNLRIIVQKTLLIYSIFISP